MAFGNRLQCFFFIRIRFGAKVLSERQRAYAQVKRELWGIVSAVKADKDYLIGTEVIIETDCLPILGMVSGCATLDLAKLENTTHFRER